MTWLQRLDAWWAYRRARRTYRKLGPLQREALFNPTPATRRQIEAILDSCRERGTQTRPTAGSHRPR
jgi:hypothetical protein